MGDEMVDLTSRKWHEDLQGRCQRLALDVLERAGGGLQRLKDELGNFLVKIALV